MTISVNINITPERFSLATKADGIITNDPYFIDRLFLRCVVDELAFLSVNNIKHNMSREIGPIDIWGRAAAIATVKFTFNDTDAEIATMFKLKFAE